MSNSRNTHRLKQNPLEAEFLHNWEDNPRYTNTLDYLLSETPNAMDGEVTERDREVAATVIQWLGSHVGQGFIEESTGVFIRNFLPDHLRFKPDAGSES